MKKRFLIPLLFTLGVVGVIAEKFSERPVSTRAVGTDQLLVNTNVGGTPVSTMMSISNFLENLKLLGNWPLSPTGGIAVQGGSGNANNLTNLTARGALNVPTLTSSRAAVVNASGQLTNSSVSDTELGFLAGVTSAIQQQLSNSVRVVAGAGATVSAAGASGIMTYTVGAPGGGGGTGVPARTLTGPSITIGSSNWMAWFLATNADVSISFSGSPNTPTEGLSLMISNSGPDITVSFPQAYDLSQAASISGLRMRSNSVATIWFEHDNFAGGAWFILRKDGFAWTIGNGSTVKWGTNGPSGTIAPEIADGAAPSNLVLRGSVTLSARNANKILRTDSGLNVAEVAIGANLNFDGTTLSGTGGGGGTYTNFYAVTNITTAGNPVIDWLGPTLAKLWMTNNGTVLFTNTPAAGSNAINIELVVYPAGFTTLSFENSVKWPKGAPVFTPGETNVYLLQFDGTAANGYNVFPTYTGTGSTVRSNGPVLNLAQFIGTTFVNNGMTLSGGFFADWATGNSLMMWNPNGNMTNGAVDSQFFQVAGNALSITNQAATNLLRNASRALTNTVAPGWQSELNTNSSTITVNGTNRVQTIATNATSANLDFSGSFDSYEVAAFLRTNLVLSPTNFVQGRMVAVFFSAANGSYDVTLTNAANTAMHWPLSLATNGATSFTVTNGQTGEMLIYCRSNNIIHASYQPFR